MYLEWEKIVKLKKYEILLFYFQSFRLFRANILEWGRLWQVKPQKSKSMQNFGYFCRRPFLFRFVLVQLWNISKITLKLTYQGINFTLFHVHHNTLELSIGHFQTHKDQGYLKLTQNFENFDIAKKRYTYWRRDPTEQQ